MSELSYSAMLRELSKNYYQHHIGFDEYRAQRKSVLDKIDEEFNGRKSNEESNAKANDSSIFMKTIAFFKNSDIDD